MWKLSFSLLVKTVVAMATANTPCRDRRLSPFGPKSIWNTPIGTSAQFVPANLYPRLSGTAGDKFSCANETAHPLTRHTCPGVHAGITRQECEAKGCCFDDTHKAPPGKSWPWCFTRDREYGPRQFHNDADYFVSASAGDPFVPWIDQGWWGQPPSLHNCSMSNVYCHCDRLPSAKPAPQQVIQLPSTWTTDPKHWNNQALSVLASDNVTVLQTQPAFRCTIDGPLLSKAAKPDGTGGCPQGYPANISILSSGPETALGAHGGSGLSALGGMIRLHELEPSSKRIAHALKIELFAHQYYYGEHPLNPDTGTPGNGGRTQYVWPATGSDGYTWMDGSPLRYNGTNPHLVPGD